MPLGRYCLSPAFLFSLVPRCEGLWPPHYSKKRMATSDEEVSAKAII
jgi:hypothetical protein